MATFIVTYHDGTTDRVDRTPWGEVQTERKYGAALRDLQGVEPFYFMVWSELRRAKKTEAASLEDFLLLVQDAEIEREAQPEPDPTTSEASTSD